MHRNLQHGDQCGRPLEGSCPRLKPVVCDVSHRNVVSRLSAILLLAKCALICDNYCSIIVGENITNGVSKRCFPVLCCRCWRAVGVSDSVAGFAS